MKLSQKKEDLLWSVINDCILEARIEISKLDTGNNNQCHLLLKNIDNILFKTGIDCPKRVIESLKK